MSANAEESWQQATAAGDQAAQQKRYRKAEQHFSVAVRLAESFGPQDPRLAASLTSLAGAYILQEKYAEAEPLCKRALAIREITLGSDHLDVAESLSMLGTVSFGRGKYAEAELYFRRALTIQEKTLGPEDRQLTLHLYVLAQTYVLQRKDVDAEHYYKRFLINYEKGVSPDDPLLAFHLGYYAILLRRVNRASEAAEVEARAKAIRAKRP